MKELIIGSNEANQRADKFLKKYLDRANQSFLYKMMRKKNITLNDKKMTGNEKLCLGDSIKIYFSEETLEKFVSKEKEPDIEGKQVPYRNITKYILYEDKNIILFNKPSGMLSQKAEKSDISVNEYLIDYMCKEGKLTKEALMTFKPSICNRLDRNTSGLLIFGKTMEALQTFGELLKEREVHKYYLCIVKGKMEKSERISGYLKKNETNNTVKVYKEVTKSQMQEYSRIETEYFPLSFNDEYTLLKVLLITGKTHQIRAHLSSIGHPLIGDTKYGDKKINLYFKEKYKLKHQLLHSYQLLFDNVSSASGTLDYLSGQEFKAEPENIFKRILDGEELGVV